MSADTDSRSVDVPAEWRAIGFSGAFHLISSLAADVDADVLAARLPDRVPFGTNSGWLALSVDREERTVLLVREDAAAIVELCTRPGLR